MLKENDVTKLASSYFEFTNLFNSSLSDSQSLLEAMRVLEHFSAYGIVSREMFEYVSDRHVSLPSNLLVTFACMAAIQPKCRVYALNCIPRITTLQRNLTDLEIVNLAISYRSLIVDATHLYSFINAPLQQILKNPTFNLTAEHLMQLLPATRDLSRTDNNFQAIRQLVSFRVSVLAREYLNCLDGDDQTPLRNYMSEKQLQNQTNQEDFLENLRTQIIQMGRYLGRTHLRLHDPDMTYSYLQATDEKLLKSVLGTSPSNRNIKNHNVEGSQIFEEVKRCMSSLTTNDCIKQVLDNVKGSSKLSKSVELELNLVRAMAPIVGIVAQEIACCPISTEESFSPNWLDSNSNESHHATMKMVLNAMSLLECTATWSNILSSLTVQKFFDDFVLVNPNSSTDTRYAPLSPSHIHAVELGFLCQPKYFRLSEILSNYLATHMDVLRRSHAHTHAVIALESMVKMHTTAAPRTLWLSVKDLTVPKTGALKLDRLEASHVARILFATAGAGVASSPLSFTLVENGLKRVEEALMGSLMASGHDAACLAHAIGALCADRQLVEKHGNRIVGSEKLNLEKIGEFMLTPLKSILKLAADQCNRNVDGSSVVFQHYPLNSGLTIANVTKEDIIMALYGAVNAGLHKLAVQQGPNALRLISETSYNEKYPGTVEVESPSRMIVCTDNSCPAILTENCHFNNFSERLSSYNLFDVLVSLMNFIINAPSALNDKIVYPKGFMDQDPSSEHQRALNAERPLVSRLTIPHRRTLAMISYLMLKDCPDLINALPSEDARNLMLEVLSCPLVHDYEAVVIGDGNASGVIIPTIRNQVCLTRPDVVFTSKYVKMKAMRKIFDCLGRSLESNGIHATHGLMVGRETTGDGQLTDEAYELKQILMHCPTRPDLFLTKKSLNKVGASQRLFVFFADHCDAGAPLEVIRDSFEQGLSALDGIWHKDDENVSFGGGELDMKLKTFSASGIVRSEYNDKIVVCSSQKILNLSNDEVNLFFSNLF